jgi:hypothetical protein
MQGNRKPSVLLKGKEREWEKDQHGHKSRHPPAQNARERREYVIDVNEDKECWCQDQAGQHSDVPSPETLFEKVGIPSSNVLWAWISTH